ncbi:hypothetical protein LUZ63_000205 [Rhynchospora breviuscula]|uniref:Retrovirus-related Pol polyprotein from transposon TNT 1-94 n=1 Tax=Rhynchospora breviuscula TaxID=2022672 RepID=A0A9Q0CUQ7_9POAL|nr:hypothetical protein LUZ63_000205 [Rhynchospora breviuscula]
MKTLFKSHGLWDLVEKGAGTTPDEIKRDAKALCIIQQAVHDTIFSKIAAAESAKQAWVILKTAYQGSSRIRTYGDDLSEKTVVAKVLRSLSPKFDHVVAAIEESKDLSIYSFDELMGSLQTHETRLLKSEDISEEKAFYTKGESSKDVVDQFGRGRGRGNSGRGRGRGRANICGRGRGNPRRDVQCYYCNKFGHFQSECYQKQREEGQVNYTEEEEVDVQPSLFMAYSIEEKIDTSSIWFLDSGCSNHMTGHKQLFEELDETFKLMVKLGDDKQIQVEGKGKVAVHTKENGMRFIHNVYFIPSLSQNLLSVGQLLDSGYTIIFENKSCAIKDRNTNQILAKVDMTTNKLFPLKITDVQERLMVVKEMTQSQLWHHRYGHLYTNGLRLLNQKHMVHGLPEIDQIGVCEGCIVGKQTKLAFPKCQAKRATKVLEIVHADLCGPMQTISLGGSKYFLLFTDDYSRMSWVYFLKNKDETFSNFKAFKALVEKQSEKKLKILRTDRGGEFLSKEFVNFCEAEGIHHELTAPYTPEQNGVAERKNRTVVEMGRSMMKCKNMPNKFWAEAVSTAVYLLNISPTKAVINQTPYEAWYERKPGVGHLKVFGCIAYVLVDSQKRKKLDGKSEKCIFIGYCTQTKGYRLFNPEDGKIIVSRNVLFDEESEWIWKNETNQSQQREIYEELDEAAQEETHMPDPVLDHESESDVDMPEHSVRRYRTIQELYEVTQILFVEDPTTFEEAAEKEEWRNAMEEEIKAIEKNKTWQLVKLPEGKNVIGVKWVFRTKFCADGAIQKFKARLVAKGYAQEYGIDYEETFSPVVRFETVRLILALAAQLKKKVYQFDVKSAFLNGDLKEEVYVEQPKGFEVKGKEQHVYKLSKALYGLKQAPRAWYSKIDTYFINSGFTRSKSEPNLYINKKGEELLIVCLYVDDMIYFGTNESMLIEFRTKMKKEFEMSDFGLMSYFLGLEVEQGSDSIFVSQRKYSKDLLKKFGMLNCNAAVTPMNSNEKLTKEDGTGHCDETKFRSLVGGLIYLTHTRPDIQYAVGVVSRFMHNPSNHHYGAAKRILRYIAGTWEHGIWYDSTNLSNLVGYCDSDWARNSEDRRSTSGQIFFLATSAISWSSKKQATVALSSAEAEYISLNSAACQAVWLRKILEDVGQVQKQATTIYCDNQSAISMTKNLVFHGRTKHIGAVWIV